MSSLAKLPKMEKNADSRNPTKRYLNRSSTKRVHIKKNGGHVRSLIAITRTML